MIIVTTPGRSGSSIFVEYCRLLGIDTGNTKWIKRYDAGGEEAQVSQINATFRRDMINGVKEVNNHLLARIQALGFELIKDPQFLIHPKIIYYWWAARKDIKIIHITREASDIVASLKRHPDMNSPVFRNHEDLIVKKEDEFFGIVEELGIPLKKIKFPDYIDSLDEVSKILSDFGMSIRNEERAAEVFDRKKIHA